MGVSACNPDGVRTDRIDPDGAALVRSRTEVQGRLTHVAPRMGAFGVKICEIDEISVIYMHSGGSSSGVEAVPCWRLRVSLFGELFRLTDFYKAARSEDDARESVHGGELAPTQAERWNAGNVIGSKRAVSPINRTT